jgi:hypothetical protein
MKILASLEILGLLIVVSSCAKIEPPSTLTKTSEPSLANVIVNTNILTRVKYLNSIVYVYGSLSNEAENLATPAKWIFYYVPAMIPTAVTEADEDSWIWSTTSNQVRMTFMQGNEELEGLIREAVIKKYEAQYNEYSKFWDIMPLMIDKLTAFVTYSGTPISGVVPFTVVHPSSYDLTMRFQCTSKEQADSVVKNILNDNFEIEVSFYFAGFKHVSTNLVSISAVQLQSVLSQTIADGRSKNPQFIHRDQKNKFILMYTSNVKKIIYLEAPDASSNLTAGLEDQFNSLFNTGEFKKFIKFSSLS